MSLNDEKVDDFGAVVFRQPSKVIRRREKIKFSEVFKRLGKALM
jgi:hypothetical protein